MDRALVAMDENGRGIVVFYSGDNIKRELHEMGNETRDNILSGDVEFWGPGLFVWEGEISFKDDDEPVVSNSSMKTASVEEIIAAAEGRNPFE